MKTLFYLILLALLVSNISCSKYITCYCGPDKTNPVMVLRNPEDSYPVYAKEYDNGVKATVDVLKKIELGADVGVKSKIVQLRENLNQESARMEILVKTNFLAYNGRPCDNVVRDKFYSFLEELAKKVYKLETLKTHLLDALGANKNNTESKSEKKLNNSNSEKSYESVNPGEQAGMGDSEEIEPNRKPANIEYAIETKSEKINNEIDNFLDGYKFIEK